jgi:mannose-1-phosphate guanylyltransferase/phosphomannomutase
MQRLGAITRTLKSAFGVKLDPGGERIYFVDEEGGPINGMTVLAAIAELALRQAAARDEGRQNGPAAPNDRLQTPQHSGLSPQHLFVAVPVWAPSIFEKIAARYGAEVVRTRFNAYALMTAALRHGVVVAGDGQGSIIFPNFQPAADGLFTIAKVMELTAICGTRFSEVIANLPRYAMHSTRVQCRWEDKGRVMRILNEQYRDATETQVDGVKIRLSGDEWALILPDADRPLFHVIAEAGTEQDARHLVEKYAGLVKGLQ